MKGSAILVLFFCSLLQCFGGHFFSDLRICDLPLDRNFSGLVLYRDDLSDGALIISGRVNALHPLMSVDISLDGGRNWHAAQIDESQFFSELDPGIQEEAMRLRIRCVLKNGNRLELPYEFPFRYRPLSVRKHLRKKVEDLFSDLERGRREDVLNAFCSDYPFRYSLKDRISAYSRMPLLLHYTLHYGPVNKTDRGYCIDVEWELNNTGVASAGYTKIMFRRDTGGEFRIYRLKGTRFL